MSILPSTNLRRLLFNVPVEPIQGTRFQPTGFPDLGAATYQAGDVDCLLVESAQSMANRLELQIWDEGRQELKDAFKGLPYIQVTKDGNYLTSSLIEAHRINSPYILEGENKTIPDILAKEFPKEIGIVNKKRFYEIVAKYDLNALIHGVFISKSDYAGGRLRIPRALSAFIEATHINVAASGGVKNDSVDPSGDTSKGFGNVPFHREEFTSGEMIAYFSIDLEQIYSYGLPEDVTNLIILISLYKIRSFIDGGMRLRTACDLKVKSDYNYHSENEHSYVLPELSDLEKAVRESIQACQKSGFFANENNITTVSYKEKDKSKEKKSKDKE